MRILLAQHGLALPKELDPDRPLSEQGRRDVRQLAEFLTHAGIQVEETFHSGKTRAQQTAELLADALMAGNQAQMQPGLSPNDPVEPLAERLATSTVDILVVGHLPFLGRLVSHLLTGTGDRQAIAFEPGSLACLQRNADGSWSLSWMIGPELLSPDTD